jgi:hypothetical protein
MLTKHDFESVEEALRKEVEGLPSRNSENTLVLFAIFTLYTLPFA